MQMKVQLFLSPLVERIICIQIKIIIQFLQIPVIGLKLTFSYLFQELVTQKWQSVMDLQVMARNDVFIFNFTFMPNCYHSGVILIEIRFQILF